MAKKTEGLDSAEVIARLREMNGQAFAVLTEVNEVVGGTGRWADGLGMCLWKSRGMELHGYEVKVSRGDWLRELKKPQKAEAVCKYCDRWWIVCGLAGIVTAEELPPTWGLIEPHGTGLRTVIKAPKLEPVAIDRHFLASIFRRAAEQSVDKAAIDRARATGFEDGKRHAEFMAEHTGAAADLKRLQESVAKFESASGVQLDQWGGGRIGDAVKVVLAGAHKRDLAHLENIEKHCLNTIEAVKQLRTLPCIVGADGE